jgi:hypothetical protein
MKLICRLIIEDRCPSKINIVKIEKIEKQVKELRG